MSMTNSQTYNHSTKNGSGLHQLIERLVKWENSNDEQLLAAARKEIAISVARSRGETAPTKPNEVLDYLRDNAPTVHDPFCGGGSIPLEAQRLGLKAVGSDLNPVAVLITKALIELPTKFANKPPINPDADPLGFTTGKGRNKQRVPWRGSAGLADDIRYYGKWMRDEAFKRIGHLYPQAELHDGTKATVIAWLWARTIPCANPACGINMPLMKTFQLSKKRNNQHWVRPIIDRDANTISFQVQDHDKGVPEEGTVDRNGATCIACGNTVKLTYVREQAKASNMGEQMTAIVAAGDQKRLFLSPNCTHIKIALGSEVGWRPGGELPENGLGFSAPGYGFKQWHQLFTKRQLAALTTISDLILELQNIIVGNGADEEYSNTVCTYLAFTISKLANIHSSFASWMNDRSAIRETFSRQAIPIVWDFVEANPLANTGGSINAVLSKISMVVERFEFYSDQGLAVQADATNYIHNSDTLVSVTDPPYYDNISYAELSDFFYVWLRPVLRKIYPELFASIQAPLEDEMIAAPRFQNAKERFEELTGRTLRLIRDRSSPYFPSSVFYAYKQQEAGKYGRSSTGWDTMLSALVIVGYQIVGTWPMRTEGSGRLRAISANALASSVLLVCRPRAEHDEVATRQEFLDELETELPIALDRLTRGGHIAPADLPQAAIGPGMEIYSKYSRVETISGETVTVREALQQINRVIGEYFDKEEGELDATSRFCVDWLKTHALTEATYGDAENIARAKNLSVTDIANIHNLITAERGNVQLHEISEYHPDRKPPMIDMTAWEGCMRMAYHLDTGNEDGNGIAGCGEVGKRMSGNLDSIERLARILYNHYDNLNQPRDAYIYNQLVSEWQNILNAVQSEEQGGLGM